MTVRPVTKAQPAIAAIPFAVIAMLRAIGTAQGIMTIWDGVYTEAQATRGKNVYTQQCASCHGPDLAGGASAGDVAPPLAGPEFMTGWDGLTVGDLFDRIHRTMPEDAPGSLSAQQNADVVAYVFSANRLPAGSTELAAETTALKAIKFTVKRSGP